MGDLDIHVKYITKALSDLATANAALDARLREHMKEEIETTTKLYSRIDDVETSISNAKFYFAGGISVATAILAGLQIYLSYLGSMP